MSYWIYVIKIGVQLFKKFPAFYEARRFITAFTRDRLLFLCWGRSIQSIPLLHISFNCNITDCNCIYIHTNITTYSITQAPNLNHKYLIFLVFVKVRLSFPKLLGYFSNSQSYSYQPISLAHFVWRVNHVQPLVSSWLQNLRLEMSVCVPVSTRSKYTRKLVFAVETTSLKNPLTYTPLRLLGSSRKSLATTLSSWCVCTVCAFCRIVLCLSKKCTICMNNISFLKHCYLFRCLCIILTELLIMCAEVTKLN